MGPTGHALAMTMGAIHDVSGGGWRVVDGSWLVMVYNCLKIWEAFEEFISNVAVGNLNSLWVNCEVLIARLNYQRAIMITLQGFQERLDHPLI